MTARNLKTRIKKLEVSRKHIDEMLVVWRLPGADVSEAVADVDHVSGDRVICLEWYGEGTPPAPKWHRPDVSIAAKLTPSTPGAPA